MPPGAPEPKHKRVTISLKANKINKNAIKRAMRCDKFTIAALYSILKIYQDPKKAIKEIPTLRFLARTKGDIKEQAERIYSRFLGAGRC